MKEKNCVKIDYSNVYFKFFFSSNQALHNKYLINEEKGNINGLPCGSDFGSPVFPYLAIGGYNSSLNDYWSGQALIMSFINVNVENTKSEEFARVMAWERAFVKKMIDVKDKGLCFKI